MNASVVEQILARVSAVLAGLTRANGRVDRGRQAAYARDEHPAINIKRGPSELNQHSERLVRHLVAFELDLHEQGDTWETATDAFHMEVHDLLSNDVTLAKLGRGLLCVGTEPMAGDADFIAGRLTARYKIQVLTRPNDLTRAIN